MEKTYMKNIRNIIKCVAFVILLAFSSGIALFACPEEVSARQVYVGGSYGGYHGGYGGYGGYHGGWHGGYHGYHGGWYYGGWWYPWAATVAFLPFYYQTMWIGGYPYYYADGIYYAPIEGGYMVVNPPQGAVNQVPPSTPSVEQLFIYPRKGQSEKQQADDRYQCHRWAVGQTGYDPTQPAGAVQSVQKRSDYQRAMSACLDARGYTAK
jgi:Family of unknown function (DUF6515)